MEMRKWIYLAPYVTVLGRSIYHYCLNLYSKKIPAQMFFRYFCKIFKSNFCTEPLRVTTSGSSGRYLKTYQNDIN